MVQLSKDVKSMNCIFNNMFKCVIPQVLIHDFGCVFVYHFDRFDRICVVWNLMKFGGKLPASQEDPTTMFEARQADFLES
jgi:hypothetical protein